MNNTHERSHLPKIYYFSHIKQFPSKIKIIKGLENILQTANIHLYSIFLPRHSPIASRWSRKMLFWHNCKGTIYLLKVMALLAKKEAKGRLDSFPIRQMTRLIFLSLFSFYAFIDISRIIVFLTFPSDWNYQVVDGPSFCEKTDEYLFMN